MSTDFLTPSEVSLINMRSWPKLNKVAQALRNQNALTPETCISVRAVARIANLEPGNLSRAIKNYPGIVTVRQKTGTTMATVGVYLSPEFRTAADYEGLAYPKVGIPRLAEIARQIPKVIYLEEKERIDRVERAAKSKADAYLTRAGITKPELINGTITIATVPAVPKDILPELLPKYAGLVTGELAPLINRDLDTLSDEDINTLRLAVAKCLVALTSTYTAIATEAESREIK